MSTATLRTTTGSLFGTVAVMANTVGSVFDAATKSIGMLDAYVSNSMAHQRMRMDADNATFGIRLQTEKAQEVALLNIESIKFQDQSEDHKIQFASAFDLIGKAIEDGKARRSKPTT